MGLRCPYAVDDEVKRAQVCLYRAGSFPSRSLALPLAEANQDGYRLGIRVPWCPASDGA
jgi:hypothetical protein